MVNDSHYSIWIVAINVLLSHLYDFRMCFADEDWNIGAKYSTETNQKQYFSVMTMFGVKTAASDLEWRWTFEKWVAECSYDGWCRNSCFWFEGTRNFWSIRVSVSPLCSASRQLLLTWNDEEFSINECLTIIKRVLEIEKIWVFSGDSPKNRNELSQEEQKNGRKKMERKMTSNSVEMNPNFHLALLAWKKAAKAKYWWWRWKVKDWSRTRFEIQTSENSTIPSQLRFANDLFIRI